MPIGTYSLNVVVALFLGVLIADIFALERNERTMEEIVARVSIEPEVIAVRWNGTEA
jgi:hypothetical protein